jgi:hypothetical protein
LDNVKVEQEATSDDSGVRPMGFDDVEIEQDAATDFEDGARSVVVPDDKEVEREEIDREEVERVEKLFLFLCGAPQPGPTLNVSHANDAVRKENTQSHGARAIGPLLGGFQNSEVRIHLFLYQ